MVFGSLLGHNMLNEGRGVVFNDGMLGATKPLKQRETLAIRKN
jgi:hypothetical protein